MEIKHIFEDLQKNRLDIHSLKAPSIPGVYAIFLKECVDFPIDIKRLDRLIYLGKSDDLHKREFKQHFNSKNTGSSTVRRSLGALLKNNLNLYSKPRGKGLSDKDCQNYCFEDDGELRLTNWMEQNLEVSVCPVKDNVRRTEAKLISELQPILCLQDCNNGQKKHIKRLRKLCADEARSKMLKQSK